MYKLNETHDKNLESWIESANTASTDFPIQNLPFGVFRLAGSNEDFRVGVAVGESIVDMPAAVIYRVFTGQASEAAQKAQQEAVNRMISPTAGISTTPRIELNNMLPNSP